MFELLPLEHNVPVERGSFSDVGAPVCSVRMQIRSYLWAEGERGACHHHYKPRPMNHEYTFHAVPRRAFIHAL
ncbi:MAG: hypothetical protein FD139_3559 [Methylocystaceae bacterium]|nr:MAG: hypothetical protein FD139_3559 [Methylocystaceae bacterium]